MIMEPEIVESLLRRHLEVNDLWRSDSKSWTIKYSLLGGRGMFATRDIQQGELIFIDTPLVIGPRCHSKYLPMCINCYKIGCPLFPCDQGCGLPVCSEKCENSLSHNNSECSYLKAWKPTCGSMWSITLLQAVAPIRALSLSKNQRELINALQCHQEPRHSQQIDLLKSSIENQISPDEEAFMRQVSAVLDTNAFETVVISDKSSFTSLRGLYPMGALQNHCCIPNTRHHFDSKQQLYVSAAVPIHTGEELTMSYTDLFWDTVLRRLHLANTKHFLCNCKRCSDPLECGSLLAALKCAEKKCSGSLLPRHPLNQITVWICNKCGLIISNRQIKSIQSGLASITTEIMYQNPRYISRFIKDELPTLVPATNHIMIDMKFRIISYFGRVDDLSWKDLSEAELKIKADYCRDLLLLLDVLGCGDCKRKGLIMYELYHTKVEILKRILNQNNDGCQFSKEEFNNDEVKFLQKKAIAILQNGVNGADDLSYNLENV